MHSKSLTTMFGRMQKNSKIG